MNILNNLKKSKNLRQNAVFGNITKIGQNDYDTLKQNKLVHAVAYPSTTTDAEITRLKRLLNFRETDMLSFRGAVVFREIDDAKKFAQSIKLNVDSVVLLR